MIKRTQEEFIEQANIVHNFKYNYEQTIYTGALNKVKIICPWHGLFTKRANHHLNGSGCKQCLDNTLRLTKEEFIERAVQIHGSKYLYCKVIYRSYHESVIITCKIHGDFSQTPAQHLSNEHGCSQCGHIVTINAHRSSLEDFINRANEIHNYKYNYSKFIYINNNTKGVIICPEHDEFEQVPASHLSGCGCPPCAGKYKKDSTMFIKQAQIVHGNKYDYSLVDYVKNNILVSIICLKHGVFMQTPSNHLQGKNCKKCVADSQKITLSEFLERATRIHGDKYHYNEFIYLSSDIKGKIFCKKHTKYFWQTPNSHLNGHGCPTCGNSISNLEHEWLDGYNLPEDNRQVCFKIGGKLFRVDGIDYDNNIIYEFYGDIWHGKPDKYDPNDFNPCNKRKYKDLYSDTLKRESLLKEAGYNLITAWESDFLRLKRKI